jgi:hypothetical protein
MNPITLKQFIFKKLNQLLSLGIISINLIDFPFLLPSIYSYPNSNYLIDIYSFLQATLFRNCCPLTECSIFELGKNNFESLTPMDPFRSRNPWGF